MRQTTLDTVATQAIADAFNTVYEDYAHPINLSASQVEHHINGNDIDLASSPLWLDDDGAIIGMAMLGIRADRSWVGGFGIAKPYRGRGLSHLLIQDVIERSRTLGLREIVLEVITTNTAAIRTYQRAGFTISRDLLVLYRRPNDATPDVDPTTVMTADPNTLLSNRPETAEPPCWQHDRTSLLNDDKLTGLTLGPPTAPQAMLVYLHPDDISIRIADIAATNTSAAHTILSSLIAHVPDKAIALVNEPDSSNALPALTNLGWQEVMRQHEMVLTLGDA